MMYSDGLSEALDKNGEEFGIERLKTVFHHSCELGGTPRMVMDRVVNAVADFEVEQGDDQTIVLIRCSGDTEKS